MADVVSAKEVQHLVAKLLGIDPSGVLPYANVQEIMGKPNPEVAVERRIRTRGEFRTDLEFAVPEGTGGSLDYALRAAKLSGRYCLADDGKDSRPSHYALIAPDGTTRDADIDVDAFYDEDEPAFILRTPVEGGLLTKRNERTLRP